MKPQLIMITRHGLRIEWSEEAGFASKHDRAPVEALAFVRELLTEDFEKDTNRSHLPPVEVARRVVDDFYPGARVEWMEEQTLEGIDPEVGVS